MVPNKIILKNQEDYIININMNNDEEQKRRMEQCYNEEENWERRHYTDNVSKQSKSFLIGLLYILCFI